MTQAAAIKLRQLRAFQAIMSAGSLSAAAGKLNLSQPAVSKQLAALELALDMQLFTRRRGGPMIPTRGAIQFFKAIEGTLSGIETIPTLAREIVEHSKIRLRIAATPPLMNSRPLMQALVAFRAKHPAGRLALESRHRMDIEEWLVGRHVDVGLALLPTGNPELIGTPLVKTRVVAVVAAGHDLARRAELSAENLAGESLILPSRQPLRDHIDQSFRRAKVDLTADIESSSAIACCSLAAAGLGIALCDPFSPTAYSPEVLTIVPWEPRVEVSYGTIIRREKQIDQSTEALLTELQLHFAEFAN